MALAPLDGFGGEAMLPIVLHLDPVERSTLEEMRDRHPKPYLRERASAVLQVADGKSALQVAQNGLLRRRDPDTVYSWIHRYVLWGYTGLLQKPRRSRSFSP
jgi:hypothetical protein